MGYIGAGPTRFNTADELTVTGDAEIGGIATVDALKLSETDVLLSAGETAIITSSNDVQIIRDGSIKLTATATGVDVTGVITTDGLTTSADITFGNNDKAIFGAGKLDIHHDGADNLIRDLGTGDNYIQTNNSWRFTDVGNNETHMIINDNGAIHLYYDNATKLSTTATGVDVTGTVTADGLTAYSGVADAESRIIKFGYSSIGDWALTRDNAATGDFYVQSGVSGTYTTRATYHLNGDISFYEDTGTTAKLFWDASAERLGLGTTSPTAKLTVNDANDIPIRIGDISAAPVSQTAVYVGTSTSGLSGGNGDLVLIPRTSDARSILFYTGNGTAAEAMRIDSSGKLFKGRTTTFGGTNIANEGAEFSAIGNAVLGIGRGSADLGACVRFFSVPTSGTGTPVGSISITGSSTAYNTSSDYRLKENVVAEWDATTRLKQLNPVRFNFITDADTTVDGFLAHEVQDVVPEAITGTKDAMMDEEYTVSAATGDIYTPAIEAVLDEDGNEVTPAVAEVIHSTDAERPEELAEGQQWRETTAAVMGTRSVPDYQGIDQSKLVPLLVKTIQELEARIVALETA